MKTESVCVCPARVVLVVQDAFFCLADTCNLLLDMEFICGK